MNGILKLVGVLCMASTFGVIVALSYAYPTPARAAEDGLPACAPNLETIDAAGLPSTVEPEDCSVEGREIVDGDIGTELPQPGTGVYAEVITRDGTQELLVTHAKNGTIEISLDGTDTEDTQTQGEAQPLTSQEGLYSAATGCGDRAYSSLRYKVYSGIGYRYNKSTTPSELSRKRATNAIRGGTSNINNTRNLCRLGDRVPVSFSYKGKTGRKADVRSGRCTRSDGQSVVSFGKLSKRTLGVTCTVFQLRSGPDKVIASDLLLNKSSVKWTTKPSARSCRRKFDLEGVVTHERGHTFGLGHVSEKSHGALTMSPISGGFCQSSERSLGRGDVIGLGRKYR